jgi:integrase
MGLWPGGPGAEDLCVFPRLTRGLSDGDCDDPQKLQTMRNWVTQRFSRMCRDVGVDCSLHDLRRTYATDRAREGVPPYQLCKLGGWASVTTVERYYVNVPDQDLARWSRPSYAAAVRKKVTLGVTQTGE